MNSTESTLFGHYIENEKDTPEVRIFDDALYAALSDKFSKSIMEHLDDLFGDALYSEKRNAFSAGLKAGIEICSFALKGCDLCE